MAYTQTELDALKEAYAAGVTFVTIGNRQISFDSAEALERRIAVMERALNPTATVSRITWHGSKGL